MFNSDTWQSHAEYRICFREMKIHFDSSSKMELWNSYPKERKKLLSLNLDPVGEFLSQYYSTTGRPAKHQAQLLRSLILFALLFNRTDAKLSLTSWVNIVLPTNPVLIALIGCSSKHDLPPLGSYYDFMDRLWAGSLAHYSRSFLLPAGKNGKKPKKQIGPDGKLIEPEPDLYSTKLLADQLLAGEKIADGSQSILQDLFFLAAVLPSLKSGLIDPSDLTISGDGTAVPVHASPFGTRNPDCSRPDCPYRTTCPRHYSEPDAQWGWDSHEKQWFFGFSLYMLCARNKQLKVELPLLINFTGAKRHDSINFLYAWDAYRRHCHELYPSSICLDSAHDNIPTYRLLEVSGINALIDINTRSKTTDGLPEDITLDKKAHPHCRAGYEMHNCGYERNKDSIKYRCPCKFPRSGITSCPFSDDCSKSSYGRTVYIKVKNDLRFHPRIPRDSELYTSTYAQRTACERVNNRVLNDYHMLNLKIRGLPHRAFWTTIIGICIHLDARAKAGMP